MFKSVLWESLNEESSLGQDVCAVGPLGEGGAHMLRFQDKVTTQIVPNIHNIFDANFKPL